MEELNDALRNIEIEGGEVIIGPEGDEVRSQRSSTTQLITADAERLAETMSSRPSTVALDPISRPTTGG